MNENGSQSPCKIVYECDHKMKIKFQKNVYELNREWKRTMNANGSQSTRENKYECYHKMKIKFQKKGVRAQS